MLGEAVHWFEETMIALMLGVMTLITFVNVVLRYVFNHSLIWGLEVVLMLFAWLVLFGIAYAFKITAHLGVDAVTNIVAPPVKRFLSLLTCVICTVYALLLLKGAWDYWAPFAALPPTTGHWFPTGIDWQARDRAFFETDQIPMPGFLRWLEPAINQGETYAKLPRVVPYTMLPIACALILFRIVQATGRVWRGEQESLIVSHEAEDAVAEAAGKA